MIEKHTVIAPIVDSTTKYPHYADHKVSLTKLYGGDRVVYHEFQAYNKNQIIKPYPSKR